MNLRPLYDRIVVKRIEERKSRAMASSSPTPSKRSLEGEVMAVGHGKSLADGKLVIVGPPKSH
jgi:chaperonin GroES